MACMMACIASSSILPRPLRTGRSETLGVRLDSSGAQWRERALVSEDVLLSVVLLERLSPS